MPIELPPGTYHAPLVPLMNRILAVREGEDVSGLRREISAAFYAHDDVTGGNQVNMYLTELVEAGVTDAHRREIAAALARYAKADPEETGHLRKSMVGGLLAGAAGLLRFFARRRVEGPSTVTVRGKLTGSLEGLQPAERKFVEELLASGRNVEIIPTRYRKTADFFIDGVKTELKTVLGIKRQDFQGISAGISNRIMTARSQSSTVIIDARDQPGMTKKLADHAIERARGSDKISGNKLKEVTILSPDGVSNFKR